MDDNINKSDDLNIDPLENDQLSQELSDTFDEPLEEINQIDDWHEEIENDFYEEDHIDSHASSKSQINWFNIGVFGFVGIAAIAIGYTQFMGDSPVSTPAVHQKPVAQTSSPQEKNDLAQQAVSGTNTVPNSPQGLLGNPDILTDIKNEEQVTKQSNADNDLFGALDTPPSYEDDIEDILSTLKQPTAPDTNNIEKSYDDAQVSALPVPSDATVPMLEETEATLADKEVQSVDLSPVTKIEPEILEEEILPTAEIISQQEVDTTETSKDLSAITSQVETLNTRLDDLTSRMDQIMDKLDAEPVMIAPAPTAAPNNAVISKLESTIATLEKRVETLSKETKKAPIKNRTTKTVAKKKNTPKVSKPKVVWELRGASPDQAYVAQRGTQNLRTVTVGDTLDGTGRITSIAIENNRWVVRGTSGIITQ